MHTNEINLIPDLCPNTQTKLHTDISTIQFNSYNTLKILYLNATSIKNKQEELTYILQSFREKIHVIAITETWVKQGEEEFIHIDGYTGHFACRPTRKGGGAAIFVLNTIKQLNTDKYSDNKNSFINVNIQFKSTQINITNIYRPPNNKHDIIMDFIIQLNKHMEKLKHQHTIITGDFNFNTLDENNQYVQRYLNSMAANGMYICNTDIVTRDISQTALDHIYTNNLETTTNLH